MRFCSIQGCQHGVFRTDKNTRLGYCQNHWKQHSTDIDKDSIYTKAVKKRARQNAIPKAQSKLRNLSHVSPDIREGEGYRELDRWFKDRQKEMTGRCSNCQGKTEAHTKHYKCSIGHILPKAYFPSIATHPDNWLELCFYGNSCHTNLDNKMIDLIDLNCFDTVIQKFTKIYPFIAQEEKRRIPPILIEYLKTEI